MSLLLLGAGRGSRAAGDLTDGAVSSWASAVGVVTLTQGTGGSQPTKAATSFNSAYAGVTGDGVDDFLETTTLTGIPTGATAGLIFILGTCRRATINSAETPTITDGSSPIAGNGGIGAGQSCPGVALVGNDL